MFLIVNRSAPLLLLLILTNNSNPEDYGKISIFKIIMTITMPIIGFCSSLVFTQKYYKINEYESELCICIKGHYFD